MNVTLAKLIPLMLTAVMIAACSSSPSKDALDAPDLDRSTQGTGGASTVGAAEGAAWTGNPLENPDSPLYNKVIYFDLDNSDIRSEFVPTLRAHAEHLAASPTVSVTIEGHGDERGTREYNVALGERRANTVKRFLMAEGVAGKQVNVMSYGEERPVDIGHNETAWALNRRAELLY